MTHIISSSLFTLFIISSHLFAEGLCYKANKNDFNHIISSYHHDFNKTSSNHNDIIFDLTDLKEKGWLYLSFVSLYPIPYADSSYGFHCRIDENATSHYECYGDDDSGRIYLRVQDYDLSVKVADAMMTNTPDDPISNEINSKENKFTRTDRTVCPKPHTYDNKREKHLPYVCYTWKENSLYNGCTRHNDVCKSIKAKHFGQYPNDYEAHQAYQRCESSTPRTTPNTNTSTIPKSIVKSKRKKEELFKSITIEDVAIYDLDYYDNLVIAVGEDDSPETRKLQSMDEHHESVMIRSMDAGKSWSKIGKGHESSMANDTVIVLDDKRILIASSMEGSGGSIMLSSDAGDTWETRYDEAYIESMKQIKGDTLIAKTFGPTIKSIDGGRNWVDVPSVK